MNTGLLRKLIYPLLLHVFIVWVLLHLNQLLPFLYRVHLHGNYIRNIDDSPVTPRQYFMLMYHGSNRFYFFLTVFLYIPLVELNYWFIIRKSSFGKAFLFSSIIGLLIALIRQLHSLDNFSNDPFAPVFNWSAFTFYALIYGLFRKNRYEYAHRRELQLQRSENELHALKAQLNPHFFFNSLNYLYGSALKENATKTASAIELLSDMMRYTILGMKENFVPLEKELAFVENFVRLQRARLPEKTAIHIDTEIVSNADPGLMIPPLLLLPFIENAFKYGISIDYPGQVQIRIHVNKNLLGMQVNNLIIEEHHEVKGNNTGIANARKRLDLLYPANYSLDCKETAKEYNVSLKLTLS